jgi:hypothetical protein
MKNALILFAVIGISGASWAQNVGIGLATPNRGLLHVASPGSNITIAAFGSAGQAGLSIDDSNPLIGFNNYKDAGVRKFMSASLGYGAILYFESGIGKLRYNMAGNRGTEGQSLLNYQSFLAIDSNGNMGLGTTTPTEAKLQIHEPAGNTQFIAAAGNNLPGISTFVPISSPSLGFNARYQGAYKFMGAGFGSFLQYSPSAGLLSYFASSAKGNADGSLAPVLSYAIDSSGNFGINTSAPQTHLHVNGNVVVGSSSILPAAGYKVSVDGKIICEELRVQNSTSWPDFVFGEGYTLPSLENLQKQVMRQQHLPGIPSEAEMTASQGYEIGDMQKRLLQKLEELYLYVFELNQRNAALEKKVAHLENRPRTK